MNRITTALLTGLVMARTAVAQELIVNGGFEDTGGTFVANVDKLMSLPAGSGVIPGWTTFNAELIWARNDNIYAQTPFGSFFLDLTGYHDSPPYAGVAQTITTTPGRSYRVSVNLGTYESAPIYSGPISVAVVVGGLTTNTLTFNPTGASNQWSSFTTDFVAVSNATEVAIVGSFTAGGAYIGLDEVSTVPLPPALTIEPAGAGQVKISWPSESGFVLQETVSFSPIDWIDSPSGETNPIVVPANVPTKFYRLSEP